jgi:hypothetical protein
MFGLNKKDVHADKLQVQVHVIAGIDVFRLATRVWDTNQRSLHVEAHAHKEFMRFAYTNPSCTVWLQRDQGRDDIFELVVRWESDKTHEVFVLMLGDKKVGDDQRAQALLNSMLSTPSIVLSGN